MGNVAINACTVAYPHPSGVQSMPYSVNDTWGTYSIIDIPPVFTYGLLIPINNWLSNVLGVKIENLFAFCSSI